MAGDITPPENYVAGESITYELTITEGGSGKDLTGASIDWYLLPGQGRSTSEAVLSTTDDGVSAALVSGEEANGRVDLTIDQGVTDALGGSSYWQLLHIDDIGDGLQKYRGPWYIETP